ncbi:RNA polymerase recycling motor ATPase HelR [Galbitalea sp. SE-J8]|uniref:RNA polymerase recycling motor ATPase HelR n=1 Tax=Galbitalea sp. SE-J8 TaxID=3054952 RepID=UPI00259D1467|nr:RNA polymerase recycling motor ATPase HelR [Galbitalea sp. SE-J8]MDM4763989.1 RNA polymerase recycling motor ATPase HelR [Galbitalea sp. SE-J8]
MTTARTAPSRIFDLPERLAAKADPARTVADERHLAAIAAAIDADVAAQEERLAAARRTAVGGGQEALDRDLDVHRITARLRTLRRFRLDVCLGRLVATDDLEPVYIGRIGLLAPDGRRLLVDWRAPAAAPFFAATLADPMGLATRRRYRWADGRIVDYWDEALTEAARQDLASLDEESAFIASLGASRSARMRDVLATLQADQDAIIRASARGALVVDGGPGTGKTVVALHRAAYLLYADERVARGGVLVVGPHEPYLGYVADVLPSLGEDGVRTCTPRDLVPEGASARVETDAAVARLKAGGGLERAIERAVREREEPPARPVVVETDWADVVLRPDDWADAFDAVDPGLSHNEARDQVREEVLAIVADRLGADAAGASRALQGDAELRAAIDRAWPLLDPVGLVAELWSNPDFLRRCAPWLDDDDVALLQRPDPRAWADADLPLLDAARQRVGDPDAARRRRREEAELADERERYARVIDDLIAADDSEMLVMSMLRREDAQNSLLFAGADAASVSGDPLAGPFAHVIVDEAQELTDAQWRMLVRRCPSRSFTVVGDRAQARHGFAESWQERLRRVGLTEASVETLTVNYRTPAEVMAAAEPVIRVALPDANVPTSVRSTGVPVRYGTVAERDAVLADWLAANADGVACVIGDPTFTPTDRVSSLTPETAKGLEFDLVVLVDPDALGGGIEGAVDRYVSMTRATRELVVLG